MNINFKKVTTDQDFLIVDQLANKIWNEHYTPIIGKAQVDYMLKKFQNFDVMKSQVEKGYHYFLIESDNKAIGYIGFTEEEGALFLSKLYLLTTERGRGQGQKSLKFIFDFAKDYQLKGVKLTVNKYNEIAIKAYKRYGFEVIDEVVADIGQGYVMDDYIFYKSIQ
ncbi:GNAT family N-acetyltransferase [Flammeovirga pacifica]|uniref:N-acetyltransferase domain-containing protein n=1 Tax=Flammeovirga pacifica TaxID=915059 RepID=A0A1S1YZ05_FLAPC|nr:GNAT family N-acetyltransferase [Flammeovirga pacifica]OHX66163.1 hypothetical protein NH26_07265 [Flammeovirga pacifica]